MPPMPEVPIQVVQLANWSDPAEFWPWGDFTPREMRCHRTGEVKVSVGFMDKLQRVRTDYDRPITVISGYRTPAHNAEITANLSQTGAHTHGRAVDIFPEGGVDDVPLLLDLAWRHGMTRCGLHLARLRFRFHLDDMTAADGFAVREDSRGLYCWTY